MGTLSTETRGPEGLDSSPNAAARTRISVRDLTKTYHTRRGDVSALDRVSLDVTDGEIMVLLGPSGCGKTTLLRCVAGLEQPDSGEITIHGRTVYSSADRVALPPERRSLGMVFQSYALWPHMTVYDNIAYSLRTAKVAKGEIGPKVAAGLATVGLERFAASYPGQLSGGQQQRVALARALVANQGVILFDEPLSNLDAKVRERLRDELLGLQRDIGFTALYVTHDQAEAAALADHIAVMEVGSVAQLGTPVEVYHAPRTRYVADFVGTANELTGTVVHTDGQHVTVQTEVGQLLGAAPDEELAPGQAVRVMFRPEHCRIAAPGVTPPVNELKGQIERSMFLGSHVEYELRVAEQRLLLRSMEGTVLRPGTQLVLELDPDRARVFPDD